MDRIIAARVYGVRDADMTEERVKCDLCGLPYEMDRLTEYRGRHLCTECLPIVKRYFKEEPLC